MEDRAAAKGWDYLQPDLYLLPEWAFPISAMYLPPCTHSLGSILQPPRERSPVLTAGQGFSEKGRAQLISPGPDPLGRADSC